MQAAGCIETAKCACELRECELLSALELPGACELSASELLSECELPSACELSACQLLSALELSSVRASCVHVSC